MSYFYSHIIEIDSLTSDLESINLSATQKKHLGLLIDSSLQGLVLNAIFNELSLSDRKILINMLRDETAKEAIMEFLSSRVEDVETKIRQIALKLKEELHADVKEAHLRVSAG